ncbi:hypothetical protein [Vibrio metschnikovii]
MLTSPLLVLGVCLSDAFA